MRLICPNCDAEYEVDDAAIPRTGRDVQCSSCGHAWFQTHPEVEAEQEAEADLYELPEGAEGAAPDVFAAEPEDDAPEPVVPVVAAPKPRTLDETVLAVLREEAERETAARRAEAAPKPAIETQTEMPLGQDQSGMAAAVRRIAKMRSGAEPAPTPVPSPKSRRDMLPAIEEINSTLRATSDRKSDEDSAIYETAADARVRTGRSGFRRGFVMLVALGVLIVVLYVVAPLIAVKVPALAAVAAAYVTAVDAARVWLDAQLRSLVETLRGYAGGQGG